MVMQNRKSTSLRIDPLARPRSRVLNMLQTANRHAFNVKLSLHPRWDHNTSRQDKQEAGTQMTQAVCSILEQAALQGATAAITELKLEGAQLKTGLPPAIGQACPNLIKQSLHDCSLGLDRTISFKQHYPNLRVLELHECDCDEADCGHQQTGCINDAGLAALSSITVLPTFSWLAGEVNIINSLVAPLTHLCINTWDACNDQCVEHNLEDMNWAQLRATLQHLQLSGFRARNEAMETFLNMPCLTHLLVHEFELGQSFAGRPCKWEELVIEGRINAQTFAHLPLHPGLLLKLGKEGASGACGVCFSMETDTFHLLPQAASNVQQAKALEWVEGRASLSPFEMEAAELAEFLSQALQLIKNVTTLDIKNGELNGAAMQALCEFVRGREDAPNVEFDYATQWSLQDMVTLVTHMPHNSTLSIAVKGPKTEQKIIQLCCAAQQKLTLRAYCTCKKKLLCEQRIRSALQARHIEVLSLHCEPYLYGRTVNVNVQPCHVAVVVDHPTARMTEDG